jgi:hypothetical protein
MFVVQIGIDDAWKQNVLAGVLDLTLNILDEYGRKREKY